ncbi:MAG: PadR family transcriptional regulator [Terracoccus sp.]
MPTEPEPTTATQRWPAEWLRGVLEVCTLAVLADGPAHGYAVASRLETAGLGQIKGGTLYPLLTRLETGGLLTSSWEAGGAGPGRKVFTITGEGTRALAERADLWAAFTSVATELIHARSGQRQGTTP